MDNLWFFSEQNPLALPFISPEAPIILHKDYEKTLVSEDDL